MEALKRSYWPGNIRELENLIERAVILSSGPELKVPLADLRPALTRTAERAKNTDTGEQLLEIERQQILTALRESGGVIAGSTGAAARLGIKRTTLQSRMQKLGISRPSF